MGHKINTAVFYTKEENFFPINVLYKKFQDFELKNEYPWILTKKCKKISIFNVLTVNKF